MVISSVKANQVKEETVKKKKPRKAYFRHWE